MKRAKLGRLEIQFVLWLSELDSSSLHTRWHWIRKKGSGLNNEHGASIGLWLNLVKKSSLVKLNQAQRWANPKYVLGFLYFWIGSQMKKVCKHTGKAPETESVEKVNHESCFNENSCKTVELDYCFNFTRIRDKTWKQILFFWHLFAKNSQHQGKKSIKTLSLSIVLSERERAAHKVDYVELKM